MILQPWMKSVLAAPGLGISLLPKAVCPVCSPAYAALLSSLGLGFPVSARYLLPLTFLMLSVSVGTLAHRAFTGHGRGPFWIALFAAGCVLMGKFWFDSTTITYTGAGLLVAASVWNAAPRKKKPEFCRACLPTETGAQHS